MRVGAYHTSASALHPRSNPAHSALADTAPAWFRLLRGRAPGESAPRPTAAAACSPPEHDRRGSDRKSISIFFICLHAGDASPSFRHISQIRARSFLLPCHVAFCFFHLYLHWKASTRITLRLYRNSNYCSVVGGQFLNPLLLAAISNPCYQ